MKCRKPKPLRSRKPARDKNLRGIYCERGSSRIYPNGSMLCHVIGFTDFDHRGIQGVEASMEEYLHGQDGYRYIEHNAPVRKWCSIAGRNIRRAMATRST